MSKLGLGIAVATFVADQAHKLWMLGVYGIQDKGRVQILPFLDLVYVKNLGISYGLFSLHGGAAQWLLAGLAVVISIGLACWLARGSSNPLWATSLGLIIGGAISNAIDRLHLGGVADFFSLHALGFYWYVFNIADMAIVAGVVGLLYDSFRESRNDASNAA